MRFRRFEGFGLVVVEYPFHLYHAYIRRLGHIDALATLVVEELCACGFKVWAFPNLATQGP